MEGIHYSKSCYSGRFFNNKNSFTMQIAPNSKVVYWYMLSKTQGILVLKLVGKVSVIRNLSQEIELW